MWAVRATRRKKNFCTDVFYVRACAWQKWDKGRSVCDSSKCFSSSVLVGSHGYKACGIQCNDMESHFSGISSWMFLHAFAMFRHWNSGSNLKTFRRHGMCYMSLPMWTQELAHPTNLKCDMAWSPVPLKMFGPILSVGMFCFGTFGGHISDGIDGLKSAFFVVRSVFSCW